MLDLAAAQSDRAWWRGCRLRSVAGATARKADASLANFAHRYHEVQRRTLCWSRPHSLVVAQGSVVLLSGKRRRERKRMGSNAQITWRLNRTLLKVVGLFGAAQILRNLHELLNSCTLRF
jgi:hypothetical protein